MTAPSEPRDHLSESVRCAGGERAACRDVPAGAYGAWGRSDPWWYDPSSGYGPWTGYDAWRGYGPSGGYDPWDPYGRRYYDPFRDRNRYREGGRPVVLPPGSVYDPRRGAWYLPDPRAYRSPPPRVPPGPAPGMNGPAPPIPNANVPPPPAVAPSPGANVPAPPRVPDVRPPRHEGRGTLRDGRPQEP